MQSGTKSHLEKQSYLKSQFPPEMALLKSQQNFQSCLKSNFLFTPILNICFKKFSRWLDSSQKQADFYFYFYWYQSTNRRFMHSHLFIHSQKSGLTIGLMVKPTLMKMYKKIRKLNLKLRLTKITSKIYAKSWKST